MKLFPLFLVLVLTTGCGVSIGGGQETPTSPAVRQATSTPYPAATPTATPAPAAQATATPAVPSAPSQPVVGVVCRADILGPWAEVKGAGPHRIEATVRGGVTHYDYYRENGVPAVSFILREEEAAVLEGYGNAWFFPARDCGNFDNVADAADYGRARHANWGHSGIVYGSLKDYLEDKPPVVNQFNVDIRNVRPKVLQGASAPPTTAAVPAPAPAQPAPAAQAPAPPPRPAQAQAVPTAPACPNGVRGADHPPVVGQTWTPAGEWRVVNFWTNEPGKDQKERKLLLSPDQNPKLKGGGSFWSWPATCEQSARSAYNGNRFSPVSVEELQAESLVST